MRVTQSRMQTSTGQRFYDQSEKSKNKSSMTKKESDECYKQYSKKIRQNKDKIIRREMKITGIRNMTVENTLKPIRKALSRLLKQVFPMNMWMSLEFLTLKKEVLFLEDKQLISTFAYLKWEKEFIDLVKNDEMNPYGLMQFESQRFSNNLFEKVQGNLFLKLAHLYDRAIASQYYDDIVRILMLTCKKCENLKKVNIIFPIYPNYLEIEARRCNENDQIHPLK